MGFLERFGKTRSAGRYFNEANKYWKNAERPFKIKDEFALVQNLIEVIRNCQLALAEDENYGDAYVLLANALLLAGISEPIKASKERSWYLVTRAASVIYAWYTLPNRDYPITKNVRQGENLFRTILDIVNAGELEASKYPMKLMNSYREQYADNTISPGGLEDICDVLLNRPVPNYQWLEETLLPAHWSFFVKVLHGPSGASSLPYLSERTARWARIREITDDMQDTLMGSAAAEEILCRARDAYEQKNWRQMLGWLADIRIINDYRRKKLGYDQASMERLERIWGELFAPTINEARGAKDVDTMLLAIGHIHSLGMDELATKLLGEVRSEVSERDMMFRMQRISENPIMMHEEWAINKTREFINEK
ncbi:MAG TPA: hypothetical protein VIH69_01410 [Dehalococcoidia bacterium]